MDRLDAMAVLLAVTEAGSLSAGARKLGMPLATVSRKLSELEAHLKTRLLTRSTRHLALTDAGRSFVAASKQILEDVAAAERAAAGEYAQPRGDLIITAPFVFGRWRVMPVVTEFLRAFSEINIRMVLADRVIHLLDDHIDLAVRIGTLPDSSFVALRVGEVRRIVCASPAFLAAHGTPKIPRDLAIQDCVSFDDASAPARWRFGESDVAVRTRLSVNSAEAAIDAALAGCGITRVLSYQATEALRSGRLVALLEEFEPEPLPVSLVYPAQGLLPIKLRAFLDFAAPRLKAQLAGLGA